MLDRLKSEPYRLFFPLGILLALGGVGHWLFYALGWMAEYFSFLHASIQAQLYLACFAGGFLMTAVPRFSETRPSSAWELGAAFAALTGTAAALFMGLWVWSEGLYALWLILLARFVVVRFLKRQVKYPPAGFIWMPPAIFLGLTGAAIIILVLVGRLGPAWMEMGRSMQEQGFMLALVLGVGGFLGPKLMENDALPPAGPQDFKRELTKKRLVHAVLAALFVASFFLEGTTEDMKGYGLRAAVVTAMFVWTRSLNVKVLTGHSVFIRLLSASFWMIALGYWLVPFFPKFHTAMLHLIFLGGFSLMLFCVSTMVVLSHSGNGGLLHKPLWVFWLVAAGTGLSLALRFIATFFGERYFMLLGVASSAWLLAAVGWLVFAAPFLMKAPAVRRPADPHAC